MLGLHKKILEAIYYCDGLDSVVKNCCTDIS